MKKRVARQDFFLCLERKSTKKREKVRNWIEMGTKEWIEWVSKMFTHEKSWAKQVNRKFHKVFIALDFIQCYPVAVVFVLSKFRLFYVVWNWFRRVEDFSSSTMSDWNLMHFSFLILCESERNVLVKMWWHLVYLNLFATNNIFQNLFDILSAQMTLNFYVSYDVFFLLFCYWLLWLFNTESCHHVSYSEIWNQWYGKTNKWHRNARAWKMNERASPEQQHKIFQEIKETHTHVHLILDVIWGQRKKRTSIRLVLAHILFLIPTCASSSSSPQNAHLIWGLDNEQWIEAQIWVSHVHAFVH